MLYAELFGIVFYALAAGLLFSGLLFRIRRFDRSALLALATGFILQTAALVWRAVQATGEGNLPLAGPSNAFALLAWALVVLALLVKLWLHLEAIAAFLLPVAIFCSAVSLFLPEKAVHATNAARGFLFPFHVAVLFVGMGSFCVAFLASLIYLIEKRELKAKKLGRIVAMLPPLESLDRLAVRSLVAGVFFLTLGIGTGIYLAHFVWAEDWVRDPKVLFSLVTWGWYLLLLAVRFSAGWKGGRFFALISIGFAFLVVTFLGVTFFFPTPPTQVLSGSHFFRGGGGSWT
ncbi:MAG TPA: cytochrome c biogenesis protein CcsA [Bdellovibrionota bacterium]|nr:cytochrome c biogenesis protein CcsA [Bdellovibrionota bacterium]